MFNCDVRKDGSDVLIRVKADKAAMQAAQPSKTGKTKLLGTTGGAVTVPGLDGVKVALNVMVPNA